MSVVDGVRRLRQVILTDVVVDVCAAVLCLAVYTFSTRSGYVLLMAGVVSVEAVVLGLASIPLASGNLSWATTIISFATWANAVAVTTLLPPMAPVMALACLFPVVLALPYVNRAGLRVYVVVTGVVILAIGSVSRIQDFSQLSRQLPGPLLTAVIVVLLPACRARRCDRRGDVGDRRRPPASHGAR